MREYEAGGIAEYLILDAREGRFDLTLYHLTPRGTYELVLPDAEGRFHSHVLPGLWLNPQWFLKDPLPEAEDLMLLIAPDAYIGWMTEKFARR